MKNCRYVKFVARVIVRSEFNCTSFVKTNQLYSLSMDKATINLVNYNFTWFLTKSNRIDWLSPYQICKYVIFQFMFTFATNLVSVKFFI